LKDIKNTKTSIIMIALVMVVAGTTLAPIQSYAARSSGFPDTSSLKDGICDGISVNLEHRDQHMNQENLCYRTNTCRQSNVGQNTLGNDNSVTGFADQSDNIQQAASTNNTTTPTTTTMPSNQTTGNSTTPTPTPRTCQECFTTILNSTQTDSVLGFFDITQAEGGITALCGILSRGSETTFRTDLLGLGIDITTINDPIACLKAAGIVFAV
jgi:hypothetical protein